MSQKVTFVSTGVSPISKNRGRTRCETDVFFVLRLRGARFMTHSIADKSIALTHGPDGSELQAVGQRRNIVPFYMPETLRRIHGMYLLWFPAWMILALFLIHLARKSLSTDIRRWKGLVGGLCLTIAVFPIFIIVCDTDPQFAIWSGASLLVLVIVMGVAMFLETKNR